MEVFNKFELVHWKIAFRIQEPLQGNAQGYRSNGVVTV